VPLVVRREAEKEMPENLRRLKERLEERPASERPEDAQPHGLIDADGRGYRL